MTDHQTTHHDETTYDRHVDQAQHEMRRRVFVVARWIVLAGVIPAGIAIGIDISLGAHSLPWLVGDLTALVVAAYLLRERSSYRVKVHTLVGLVVLLSAVALGHFGPTLGTGIFLFSAVLVAALLLSWRGVILTFVALVVVMVGVIAGTQLGILAPRTLAPSLGTWVRIAISTAFALAFTAFIIKYIQSRMRSLIIAELRARQRAQDAQAVRARALQQLEASQRFEALGRLAGGVAHDVNNALAVIQGNVGYLETTDDDAERKQVLEEVRQGVVRAASTVSQLLVFARRQPSSPGSTEPGPHLEKVARSFARLMPANIDLSAKVAPTAHVALSPASFEQVILNLVLNARDAMPRGGTIELRSSQEDDRIIVEVADEGSGMPPETAARVFEPFFTTKGGAGTGLGLPMVQRTIEQAQGEIRVDSQPGRGTVVRMNLPAVSAPAKRPTAELRAVTAPSGGRLLLLEDEVDVTQMMDRILSGAGFQVDAVRTTAEAMTRIATRDYNAFITDGEVLDGPVVPAIEAFRARWSDGPIILCSGSVERLDVTAADAQGSFSVLSKPFTAAELVARVNEMLVAAPKA